jgi:Uma2 family endonuclease
MSIATPQVIADKRITPHELLSMSTEKNFELVDGKLVELNMSGLSSKVGIRLAHLLSLVVIENELGDVYGMDCGYQCFSFDEQRVRKPDVSFVATGRLAEADENYGYIKIAPDLAVEVISPNDLYHEVEAKTREYLKAGVRLVWTIDPIGRFGRVHRLNGPVSELTENDVFDGEDVIPGFKCTLGDTIPKPNKAEPKADEPKNNG